MIPKIFKKNKKGAILFTVTMVMMVMVIIMMATFTVVVAIQKQAINNFTDSQAYITAKSTLDAFIECVRVNPDNDGNGKGDYDDLREMMIGKPTGSGKEMSGGMSYDGTINPNDTGLKDKIKYVEVTLPVATEMGELVGKGVKVQRLDRTTFKVSVTAISGGDRDTSGALKPAGNSVRTVSRIISLSANPSNSIFDSALVSCAGDTQLLNTDTALYGGYVNSSGGQTILNGGCTYVGRVYSKGELTDNSGSPVSIYLSTTRKADPSGGDRYELDFLESATGIRIPVNVYNMIPKGAEADPKPPVGNPNSGNPYIYASGGSSSYVILGDSGYLTRTIGEATAPIDIYSEGSITIHGGTTVYGNVYARGSITCNGTINGIKQPNSSAAFPEPYAVNSYKSVGLFADPASDDTILNQPYTKQGYSINPTTRIRNCFGEPSGANDVSSNTLIKYADLTTAVKAAKTGNNGSTQYPIAYAGKMATWPGGGSTHTGTINIMLGKEDIFIRLPDAVSGGDYFDGGKIIVTPDSSIADDVTKPWLSASKYGNVYLYTNMSGTSLIKGNTEIYTDWYGNGTYDGSEKRQYGSKAYNSRLLEAEIPSHVFWLIGGSGLLKYDYGFCRYSAYIYAKDVIMGGITWDAPAKGMLFTNTDAFYDQVPVPVGGSAAKVAPMYIGSTIGAKNAVQGGPSIFVEPPSDNIFSAAGEQSLKDFTWSVSIYKGI